MKYILFFSLLFISSSSFSQDSIRKKKVKILPVPSFGYSPETNFYFGAVALFTIHLTQDSLTRSSNAKVEFNYTLNKQIIIETGWNYFTKEEKWFSTGRVHYSKYPDLYFGVGANSTRSDQVSFESNRVIAEVSLYKKVRSKWFLGLDFRHFNYFNFKKSQDSIVYSELKNEDRTGIGWTVVKDNRDHILTPTQGEYLKLSNNYTLGRTNYSQLIIDARKYLHWGKKMKQVFSARLYSKHIFGAAPFYDISLIGGDNLVRGYYYGRFRDNHLSTLQLEYRSSLFWRIGLSGFGGMSLVYPDFSSIATNNWKPNVGIGLRFLVDKEEGTNLRFDYAVGMNGESGFYVSFGESF